VSRSPRWFAAKKGRRDANQAPIVRALRKLGHFVVDTAGVGDGVLDTCVFPRGRDHIVWLELKTPAGELNDAQHKFIAQLEARGIAWGVARNLDEALKALR
jgi:hypothetical protein